MLQAAETFDDHACGVDGHRPDDSGPRDPTFRKYTPQQAQEYALGRGTAYSPLLYSAVFSFHTDGGGDYERLLDVGCGPGNATRDLATSFCEAIGIDPSDAMIAIAREKGYKSKNGNDVIFEVISGERMEQTPGVEPESVDVITAAMAAHWCVMPDFWESAAKVLKPGGTVALWTCSSFYAHPSTPNYERVQQVLFRFEREKLAPYETPYLRLSKNMYDDLPLPWDCDPAQTVFPREKFVRKEWDRDGKLSNGKGFFGARAEPTTLTDLENGFNTASMVTRWREAHPDLVGTEEDVVKETIRELREALGGKESFVAGTSTALLLFSKVKTEEED